MGSACLRPGHSYLLRQNAGIIICKQCDTYIPDAAAHYIARRMGQIGQLYCRHSNVSANLPSIWAYRIRHILLVDCTEIKSSDIVGVLEDSEDAKMIGRLGQIRYLAMCASAVLWLCLEIWNATTVKNGPNAMGIGMVIVPAALLYLAGLSARYITAGR